MESSYAYVSLATA